MKPVNHSSCCKCEDLKNCNNLMGAGLYSLNGVSLITPKRIPYIFIRMTYGFECLHITFRQLQLLQTYYRKILHKIQNVTQSTGNPACYLLLGAMPIDAIVHIRALSLLATITRCDESMEYQLIERPLAVKNEKSYSWEPAQKNVAKIWTSCTTSAVVFDVK